MDDLAPKLESLITFLQHYNSILSVNLVNFLTDNLWERVPFPLASELLQLSTDALCILPTCVIPESVSTSQVAGRDRVSSGHVCQLCTLQQFVKDVERHRLEHLDVLKSVAEIMKEHDDREPPEHAFNKKKIEGYEVRPKMNSFMTEKKSHEVETMASVVAAMAKQANIDQVVDIGSGKGYLGQCLALQYSLKVLGIDSSHSNSKGAQVRGQKMRKQWPTGNKPQKVVVTNKCDPGQCKGDEFGLSMNERAFGKLSLDVDESDAQVISGASHHQKIQIENENKCQESALPPSSKSPSMLEACNEDQECAVMRSKDNGAINNLKETGILKTTRWDDRQKAENEEATGGSTTTGDIKTCGMSLYTPVTAFIDVHTDLGELLYNSQIKQQEKQQRVILSGLHTCGDLSSSVLRLFLSNLSVPVLCNVPCCYHLLTEEFEEKPATTDEATTKTDAMHYGFPMSDCLRSRKTSIGSVGRMVACMAAEKLSAEKKLSTDKLFYRAVLQVILKENYTIPTRSQRTGKLASKCRTFVEYTHRAMKKMGYIDDQLSDDKIQQYYTTYEPEMKKLEAFNLLRATLAPSIEALILLDKLCFLREQEVVQNAHLVRLFDPIKSPRCYAIIATR